MFINCEHENKYVFYPPEARVGSWHICFDCMRGGSSWSWAFDRTDDGTWSARRTSPFHSKIMLPDIVRTWLEESYRDYCSKTLDEAVFNL